MNRVREELSRLGNEVLEIVPLPQSTDRAVRFRTVEDALEEFERSGEDGSHSYLVQVRKRNAKSPTAQPARATSEEQAQSDLGDLFRQAELLLVARDYALARNIFKAVIKSGKRTADALLGVGRTFDAEGKYAQAIRCFEESIAYSGSGLGYVRLADVAFSAKRYAYAAETAERGLTCSDLGDSERNELRRIAFRSWDANGDVERAEEHLRAWISERPEQEDLNTRLGIMLLKQGRCAEAKTVLQSVNERHPMDGDAWFGSGICLLREGAKDLALAALIRSLELNIHNEVALHYMVRTALEIRQVSDAERIVKRFIASSPVNIGVLYSLAHLQYDQGKMGEARRSCERILSVRPDHAEALKLLARVSDPLLSGRKDGAQDRWQGVQPLGERTSSGAGRA